ncbi:MAG: MurR/RpiR family transcriptional regulator [Erysipelotrichaceae bacterium]|nr:MurR/RpiR family transcriptional regulator [Erysipelotrichaceae bacterium]
MSCIIKIQEIMDSLTTSEQRIANFIIDNKDDVIRDSAQVLAEKIKTSPATLVRFSKSLGYSGLTELKISLAMDTRFEQEDLTQGLKPNDKIDVLMQKTAQHRISCLEKLIEILNPEAIQKAVDLLKDARCVYLIGIGASSLVCRDFFHKMTRIGHNIIYTGDSHIQISAINSIRKDDVLLAVSYGGETKEVVTAAKTARKNGAKVIAITQMGKNSLSKYSDILCNVPKCERYLRVGAISSRDDSMYISDLLYIGVLMNEYEEGSEKLKQSRSVVNNL